MQNSERKEYLRNLIPKTKNGDPKTDRLETLDAMLYGRKFSDSDLDFVEKEILSAVDFFANRKLSTAEDNIGGKDAIPETNT